ncbi:MAG: RNA repair transcriptional activator RtcR [Planctomycetota bacterium]
MDTKKKRVVIGLLGPVLDKGVGPERWEHWRPTVSLCQHENLLVDRFELLYQKKFTSLAEQLREDIRIVSPETEMNGSVVEIGDPWDFEEVFAALHDFARAYPFRPDDEEYFVHITTGTHVAQICMFLLTESRHFPARLIQTSPPLRSRAVEVGDYQIIDLDLSKYDRIATRFRRERTEGVSFLKSGIETKDAAFNRLIERIERVAIASKAPILLTGPTGAGKSLLARRIYGLKKARRQVEGAFVEVNCATLRGDAAMSALFGHVKGAFTGAMTDRAGLLRTAHGGVLFLDEISEVGLDEQAMLLRCLEEKVFLPVGSDREVQSDFQLIAGTNRDLLDEVRRGRFREDLLARINLWTFRLPGLRERREDVEPNLRYELEEYERRTGHRISFNREALERFLRFAAAPDALWRGNFRDLNGAVVRMATLAPSGRISADIVGEEIERLRSAWRAPDRSEEDALLAHCLGDEGLAGLDRFDRVQLADVLRVCAEAKSLSGAGRILFSASRARKKAANDADRLRKYLARFGIDWRAIRPSPGGIPGDR